MSHPANQFSQIFRQRRTAPLARLPSPEGLECGAMPFDEGLRLDDYQRVAPVEQFCERDHGETKRGRGPARFRLTFLEQGELLSEEQILGDQSNSSRKEQPNQRWQSRIL